MFTTKADAAPAAATSTPPIAGPTLRAMLKLMLFMEMACGTNSMGTCSRTEACQAGPSNAMPAPMQKQKTSRLVGVTRPRTAKTESNAAARSEIDSAAMATTRRSNISAIAPEPSDSSIEGMNAAVWTSATI